MEPDKRRFADMAGEPSHWAQLSDEEILSTDFCTDDPESLPNLLDSPPDNDEVPEIEFYYDTGKSGSGMVRCIHCKRTAKNHNKGVVLRFSNGTRMLYGKDCGAKQYGARFANAQNDFMKAKDRKKALERRQSILDNKYRLKHLFEGIAGDPCWAAYRELKRQFNRAMSGLSYELAEAVQRRDGKLFIEQEVSDVAAEAAYEKRTGRSVKISKRTETEHWRLNGQPFFDVRNKVLHQKVASLVQRAKAALEQLSEGAGSTHELKVFNNGFGKLITDLRDCMQKIDDLPRAFSADQVEAISEWSQNRSEGKLLLTGNKMYRTNRSGAVREHRNMYGMLIREEISLPDPFPAAPHDKLDQIESLLSS